METLNCVQFCLFVFLLLDGAHPLTPFAKQKAHSTGEKKNAKNTIDNEFALNTLQLLIVIMIN